MNIQIAAAKKLSVKIFPAAGKKRGVWKEMYHSRRTRILSYMITSFVYSFCIPRTRPIPVQDLCYYRWGVTQLYQQVVGHCDNAAAWFSAALARKTGNCIYLAARTC